MRRLGQGVGDIFDHVARVRPSVVLDVVATTEAGDGNPGVAARTDGGEQSLFADGLGDLVLFDLVPERARHAS